MHVVATHTDFPLYWPPRLERLSTALRDRGDRLTVVEIAGAGGHYDFAGQRVSRDGWNILFEGSRPDELSPSEMARALYRRLDDLRPDVVLAGGIAFPSGATAVRWCRARRRGVVVMDDVRTVDVPRSRAVNAVKRRIYGNVDGVLVPAPTHDDSYAFWGIPRDKIFHGLNVVDNQWFARNAETARENGAPDPLLRRIQGRFFLGVGRQNANKNWLCALEAYATYRSKADMPWEFILVGDGPARSELEHWITDRHVAGVHFVGFLPQQLLCQYYALAGALVLPSFHETWGLVVNEAMACELPVLASNACGCVEALVKQGETGWTFDPDDPQELAERMLPLSQLSDDERRQMGERSGEVICDWGLDRFVKGALTAIDAVKDVRRPFRSPLDRLILTLWKGRYRPL